jgi:hypothetical protein
MTVTTKRALTLAVASAVIPLVFITGGPVIGLIEDWPTWLLYVWPTSVMFVGLAGVTPLSTLLWASALSLALNAVIWVAVGLPILWAARYLPRRVRDA